jgi:hypothetical protein
MKPAILLVSEDRMLSFSRAELLKKWKPVVVDSAKAPYAMATNAWDLLILCQTIPDDIAARLAFQMAGLHPAAKVLSIEQPGQPRYFPAMRYTVNMGHPMDLPNRVASIVGATAY